MQSFIHIYTWKQKPIMYWCILLKFVILTLLCVINNRETSLNRFWFLFVLFSVFCILIEIVSCIGIKLSKYYLLETDVGLHWFLGNFRKVEGLYRWGNLHIPSTLSCACSYMEFALVLQSDYFHIFISSEVEYPGILGTS